MNKLVVVMFAVVVSPLLAFGLVMTVESMSNSVYLDYNIELNFINIIVGFVWGFMSAVILATLNHKGEKGR